MRVTQKARYFFDSLNLFRDMPRSRPKEGEDMKYLFTAALVGITIAGLGSANAAGGCGAGFHRGPYGGCQPNRAVVVAPGAVVVAPAPVVVAPVVRACPFGFVWRYGACRPI